LQLKFLNGNKHMKHFKFLLINVVAFGLLFFLFSLLFPSQVVTSKTVSITGSKQAVVEKLTNTANWKQWNTFNNNNNVKNNSQNNSDTIIFLLANNANEISSNFVLYIEQTNAILLNWAIVEKLPWYKPWKKFSAMVLNKQVAAAMDTSLNNFKVQIEAVK
jgi:hypothetical protein